MYTQLETVATNIACWPVLLHSMLKRFCPACSVYHASPLHNAACTQCQCTIIAAMLQHQGSQRLRRKEDTVAFTF